MLGRDVGFCRNVCVSRQEHQLTCIRRSHLLGSEAMTSTGGYPMALSGASCQMRQGALVDS